MLVRTVTARIIGLLEDWAAASTAALSILLPPEAWTVSMLTLSSAAERTAAATVLEVEEDLTAGSDQVADELRPLRGEELFANFVGGGGLADGLYQLASLGGAWDVKRHNKPIFGKHRLPV